MQAAESVAAPARTGRGWDLSSVPSRSMSVHSTCLSPCARNGSTASPQTQAPYLASSRACARAAPPRIDAHIECKTHALGAEALQPADDRLRLLDRGAADDDALQRRARADPRSPRPSARRRPPAAWGRRRRRARARVRDCQRAVLGAVEIDDVKPAAPERAIAAQQLAAGSCS